MVVIEGRIMPWNYTFATNASRWLNVNDINRFYPDFDPAHTTLVKVYLSGWVNEPCPAQATFGAPGPYCQWAFHGHQSQVRQPWSNSHVESKE